MTEATPEYVTQTSEGACRIAGTRVSLDSIVHAYWDGRMPEAIAADFPTLSVEQVHGAIAFYLRNKAQIDRHIREQKTRWQSLQRESTDKHGALLKRLRESSRQPTQE